MLVDDSDERASSRARSLILSLAVVIGIALFTIGFVVTVVSLSEDSVASARNVDDLSAVDGGSFFGHTGALVLGLVLSMSGVLIATTVPAAHFLRDSKGRT